MIYFHFSQNSVQQSLKKSEMMLGASNIERKINIWSANKYLNELHTAVSVAFSVPPSVQNKNWWKTALIYSFTADSVERGGAMK